MTNYKTQKQWKKKKNHTNGEREREREREGRMKIERKEEVIPLFWLLLQLQGQRICLININIYIL